MNRIFPDAKDYKTVNMRIGAGQRQRIEEKLGSALLPGQREQYQYFEMTRGDGAVIGTIFASTQKGEFGAIEFVFGLDTSDVIRGVYIQRSRERDQSFKEKTFLDQFVGMSMKEALRIADTFKGKRNKGTLAVVGGLKKELVTYQELVTGK